jgi:hypothetical protein
VELHLPDALTAIGDRAFSKCTNLRCLIFPPALISLDTTAFDDSTINLRMLVVPSTDSVKTTSLVLNLNGVYRYHSIFANVQLVSAPDVVVASLGGVFAAMSTMTKVGEAQRAVRLVDHCFWTRRTQMHQVFTLDQLWGHTLLLVGARVGSSLHLQLPALPNELWLLVLEFLRRSDLGRRR